MNAFITSFWPRFKLLFRTMRHVFPSSHYALLALFFFGGLEFAFALRRLVFLIIAIILAITVVGIILVRSEEQDGFHPTQAILPALAAMSVALFALFLPINGLLHAYFLGAAVMFFFILKHGAKQAYPTWNWVISLVVLFLAVAATLGWRFTLYAPPVFVLGILFLVISTLSVQSLVRYAKSTAEAWLLALTIGLVLMEVIWALQFLPLHYMVQAGVIVAAYYVLFQLTSTSMERMVRKKDIWEYVLVGGGAIGVLLFTANWL